MDRPVWSVVPTDRTSQTNVLNGIAYDAAADRLFVTGKLWPKLFEIKLKLNSKQNRRLVRNLRRGTSELGTSWQKLRQAGQDSACLFLASYAHIRLTLKLNRDCRSDHRAGGATVLQIYSLCGHRVEYLSSPRVR